MRALLYSQVAAPGGAGILQSALAFRALLSELHPGDEGLAQARVAQGAAAALPALPGGVGQVLVSCTASSTVWEAMTALWSGRVSSVTIQTQTSGLQWPT